MKIWLLKQVSSISSKLFLWFWLITIVSIVTTRFISMQLMQTSHIVPTHKGDLHRLDRVKNQLLTKRQAKFEDILVMQMKTRGKHFIVKNEETNEVIPLSTKPMHIEQRYLETNTLTNLSTVKFRNARLTGPQKINIEKQPYQLYILSREKPYHFGSIILQLPSWLRITIPIAISFLLCWLLAKSLSRPITDMKKAAINLGKGDLSARLNKHNKRNDELGDLARTFNDMASNLERNIKAQQRLLGDVSHELRSPMTRLQVAVALAEKSKNDPESLIKHLARCELEVTRLDEMIADVLSLSRLENTIENISKETTDTKALLTMIIDDAQYLANDKNIKIVSNLESTPTLEIDPTLISSAVSNVVNNAVKYTHECTQISVNTFINDQQFVIEIADQGTGVPEEYLADLFKPFFRTAQARDRSSGGTGLGLAIAKYAIMSHSGTIEAKNNADNGLTVSIALPY